MYRDKTQDKAIQTKSHRGHSSIIVKCIHMYMCKENRYGNSIQLL